jgi:hypothetical protein
MASSGMLRRIDLIRIDVSEERSDSFISMTTIGELGTTLAVTSSVRRLLVAASIVPSSPFVVILMMGGGTFLRNVGSYKSYTA